MTKAKPQNYLYYPFIAVISRVGDRASLRHQKPPSEPYVPLSRHTALHRYMCLASPLAGSAAHPFAKKRNLVAIFLSSPDAPSGLLMA